MHAVFSPFLKNLPSLPVRPIRTPIFTKVLITAPTRDLGSFNFQCFPLRKKNVRRIAMASSLLNFFIWDGSANIAARHSSIRLIGSKVKSPAWSCLTSSFANIAMWKRESSDCIQRKSLFEVALAPENTAARKKNRLFDDRKRRESRHRNVRRACK